MQILYLRFVRLMCTSPALGKIINRFIARVMTYVPGIDTRFRWKVISFHIWKDEIKRSQYRRNKIPAPKVARYELKVATRPLKHLLTTFLGVGHFDVISVSHGIFISGKLGHGRGDKVVLRIGNVEISERSLTHHRRDFLFWLKGDIIKILPAKARIELFTNRGEKLFHAGQDHVILYNPMGDESLISTAFSGAKVNKKGILTDSVKNSVVLRQEEYFDEYHRLAEVFERQLGKTLFLSYGTLLGCIRDGAIIPHDDDFDISYFSDYSKGSEVRMELLEMIKLLRIEGYEFFPNTIGSLNQVKRTGVNIILNFAPFWLHQDKAVLYEGKRFKCRREDILPARAANMAGQQFLVPNNPEIVLRGYYGDGWRVPDLGYTTNKSHADKKGQELWRETLFPPRELKAMGFPISF